MPRRVLSHFNSFGGNSVACSIADAVLDVIVQDDLQANALHVSNCLKEKLRLLVEEFKQVGDVRGDGLFLDVELVHDRHKSSLKPYTLAARAARHVVQFCKEVKHVLLFC